MEIRRNQNVQVDKWHALLRSSIFSNPFQSLENYNLFNKTKGYSADVFAVEDEGKYTSLCVVTIQKEKGLKAFFSKRGIIYGGALILNHDSGSIEYLLKEIKYYYKRELIYLEFRNHHDYSFSRNTFEKVGYFYHPHLNVQLNTEDVSFDQILNNMHTTRRRQVRQTFAKGVTSRGAIGEEEVYELYLILKDLYNSKVKLPLNPFSFFLDLYKSDIGKVFVVEHNGRIVGGAFCVKYANLSINTLYYAGLTGYAKNIYPTHVAIVEVIKFAISNNLKMVDFMGAGKPGVDYGVRKYKLQFGGDLVEHGRYKLVLKPVLYKLGEFGLRILQKIN